MLVLLQFLQMFSTFVLFINVFHILFCFFRFILIGRESHTSPTISMVLGLVAYVILQSIIALLAIIRNISIADTGISPLLLISIIVVWSAFIGLYHLLSAVFFEKVFRKKSLDSVSVIHIHIPAKKEILGFLSEDIFPLIWLSTDKSRKFFSKNELISHLGTQIDKNSLTPDRKMLVNSIEATNFDKDKKMNNYTFFQIVGILLYLLGYCEYNEEYERFLDNLIDTTPMSISEKRLLISKADMSQTPFAP